MSNSKILSKPLMRIDSYEHVGIRVTDRDRAVKFYERLGFQVEAEYPDAVSKAIEIVNEQGVRINLICNGAPREGAFNILQDSETKAPGLTHIAFAVADLDEVTQSLLAADIPLTDGPKSLPRREYIFFRDPDGNVIELNEYLRTSPQQAQPALYRLHDNLLSGNTYKVRLVLKALGLSYSSIQVDLLNGGAQAPSFLAVNPLGQVPVLQLANGVVLRESHAIMAYLAHNSALIPSDRKHLAEMWQWLSFEQQWLEPTLGTVRYRLHILKQSPESLGEALPSMLKRAREGLEVLNAHLIGREWVLGSMFSLADISLFAYVHVAEEATVTLSPYGEIRRWLERVARRPAHAPMNEP